MRIKNSQMLDIFYGMDMSNVCSTENFPSNLYNGNEYSQEEGEDLYWSGKNLCTKP